MNIYVGNLSFDCSEEDIRVMFAAHGAVDSVRLITDRDTGRSKGFAFVEMPDNGEAQAAINAVNGSEMMGRTIKVNEARPREERPQRRMGGGGGGGRGRW
ncbi:RNA-binding protein [bacterium]|nr:RNA-binding protein [bacterium]